MVEISPESTRSVSRLLPGQKSTGTHTWRAAITAKQAGTLEKNFVHPTHVKHWWQQGKTARVLDGVVCRQSDFSPPFRLPQVLSFRRFLIVKLALRRVTRQKLCCQPTMPCSDVRNFYTEPNTWSIDPSIHSEPSSNPIYRNYFENKSTTPTEMSAQYNICQ